MKSKNQYIRETDKISERERERGLHENEITHEK